LFQALLIHSWSPLYDDLRALIMTTARCRLFRQGGGHLLDEIANDGPHRWRYAGVLKATPALAVAAAI